MAIPDPIQLYADLIELRTLVRDIKADVESNKIDIKELLAFMNGIKMLLTLSIGGGALSIITLIITILNNING